MRKHTTRVVIFLATLALCLSCAVMAQVEGQTLDHQQLVVRGAFVPNVEETYRQRYPDVALDFDYNSITAEEVAQRILTKDDSVDIFTVCADYSFSALVEKGFVADLSASEIIKSEVAAMEPAIATALRDELGHIVAYPAELRFWSCGIHEGYWRLAFGERPLPTNMDELMDAWIDWESERTYDYPDMEFIIGFDYAQYCQKIITFFVQQNDTPDGQPDFNAHALRNILNKLQRVYEIRAQSERRTVDTADAEQGKTASIVRFRAWDEAMNEPSTVVAKTSEWLLYDMYMGNHAQATLTFAAGDAPQTDGTLYVYVVNPFSCHLDAALRFIECASELESKPCLYYAVHPESNEPYEWPDFQKWVESSVQDKAELEEMLNNAEDSQSAELADVRAMIDYDDQYFENRENERWMISAQTIAGQRKLMERLDLHLESLYLGAPGSTTEQMISELCARYASGSMTMDALLDELSRKIRMMQLENEA